MSFFCPLSLGKKLAWNNNNNNYKVPKDQSHNKWGVTTGACDEDFSPYQTAEKTLDKYGIDTNSLPRRGCHPTKLELASLLQGASIDNPADVTAIMLWSYMPSHATDIAVSKGEKVTVFYRNGDWAFVRNSKDGQGFVPLNYCTLRRRNSLTDSPMVLMRSLGKATVARSSKQDTLSNNKVTVKSTSKFGKTGPVNSKLSLQRGNKNLPVVVKETSEWLKLFQYDDSDTDSTDSSDDDNFLPADIFGRISVNFEVHGAFATNDVRRTSKPTDHSVKASDAGNNVINIIKADTKQSYADRKYLTLPNGFDCAPTYSLPDVGHTLGIKPPETKPVNSSFNVADIQKLKANTGTTNSDKTCIKAYMNKSPSCIKADMNELHVLSKSDSQSDSTFSKLMAHKYKFVTTGDEMVAIFDFIATCERDLNLKTGQRVRLINITDETWWWVRDTNGRQGFVPKAYLNFCVDEPLKTSVNNQTLQSNIGDDHIKVEHPLLGAFAVKQEKSSHDMSPKAHTNSSFPHIKNCQGTIINNLHSHPENTFSDTQPIQHNTNESQITIETLNVSWKDEEKRHLQQVNSKGIENEIVTPKTTDCTASFLESGMRLAKISPTVKALTHHCISDLETCKITDKLYSTPLDLIPNCSHDNSGGNASKTEERVLPSYEEVMSKRTDTRNRELSNLTSTCNYQEQHEDENNTPKVWLTDSILNDNKPRVLRRRQTISTTTNKHVRFKESSSDSEQSYEPLATVYEYDVDAGNEILHENQDTTVLSTSERNESSRFADFVKVNDQGETEIGTWC